MLTDKQEDNFLRGVGEGAGGAVEGLGQVIGDPKGTLKGLKAVADDPGLLLDGYKETLDKHGVAGQAAFEVLGTKGAGAALKKVGDIGTISRGLNKIKDSAFGATVLGAHNSFTAVDTKAGNLVQVGLKFALDPYRALANRALNANPQVRKAADATTAWVEEKVKGAQQVINWGTPAPVDPGPLGNPITSRWAGYGSAGAGAVEGRQETSQQATTAAFRSLLEGILGVAV